jgi:hypothetical protein
MSDPKNCHYVTRGLTKPWEVDQRQLWFYDFEKDEVRQLSSKSLFAGDGLLTKHGELRFKQLIEDPLIQLREMVFKDPTVSQFDWKLFRAALLYFMGQTQRFQVAITGSDSDGKLETFLQKDDSYYDQLALAAQQKYKIVGVGIPDSQRLFFTQAGFFAFFFLDPSMPYGFSSGFAVPLTPHWGLAMIRTDVDIKCFDELQLRTIPSYSIGFGEHSKQVVIPPDIREHNDDQTIKLHMKEKRAQSKQMTADFLKMKGMVDQMYAIAGLTVDEGLAAFEIP